LDNPGNRLEVPTSQRDRRLQTDPSNRICLVGNAHTRKALLARADANKKTA
jgi:hypothetical protein